MSMLSYIYGFLFLFSLKVLSSYVNPYSPVFIIIIILSSFFLASFTSYLLFRKFNKRVVLSLGFLPILFLTFYLQSNNVNDVVSFLAIVTAIIIPICTMISVKLTEKGIGMSNAFKEGCGLCSRYLCLSTSLGLYFCSLIHLLVSKILGVEGYSGYNSLVCVVIIYFVGYVVSKTSTVKSLRSLVDICFSIRGDVIELKTTEGQIVSGEIVHLGLMYVTSKNLEGQETETPILKISTITYTEPQRRTTYHLHKYYERGR